MKFGRWTVLRRDGSSKAKKAIWLCLCVCGRQKSVVAGNLVSGISASCGCLKHEVTVARNKAAATHGMSRTVFHNIWWGMIQRCRYPQNGEYHNYGARGIKLCEFLAAHPANLIAVIGHRPTMIKPREYSVDRKNNNGHYSCGQCPECKANGWPLNLHWAKQKIQMRNVRYNRIVEIDGVKRCVAEWAELLGIPYSKFYGRVANGWTGKALLKP